MEALSGRLGAWFEEEIYRLPILQNKPPVLTVIGSGGKTSLIWYLAQQLRGERKNTDGIGKNGGYTRKILVTPTTKMQVPPSPASGSSAGPYDRYCPWTPEAPWTASEGESGITLAGIFNEETGKLESLPPETLERIVSEYDLVLIEGDGSRGLPLKGWAEREPAVPPFTTITVGILPLWPLGMKVSETIVHRLPLFSRLSGAREGDVIRQEHLARVITGTPGSSAGSASRFSPPAKGLFAAARGRRILFFNQVEDDKTLGQARELVSLLPKDFRAGLGGIIAGSVERERFTTLLE
ncbi:hydroxylase accessory protein YqeC [Spirochaetia bacterium]|nr:hydroxylase accessory protein YqeC [Spirochaetia bacterium]